MVSIKDVSVILWYIYVELKEKINYSFSVFFTLMFFEMKLRRYRYKFQLKKQNKTKNSYNPNTES